MIKSGKLFCFGCAVSILLMAANPVYTTPKETVETETQSENKVENNEDNKKEDENTTEEQDEISIDEETGKLKISEAAIKSYKELQNIVKEGKLEAHDYGEVTDPTDESVTTGDIMLRDNDIYICLKLNKECTWWALSEDTMQYKADVKLSENDKVYRKTMNQTAYPDIKGLIGYNGETLSTVVLPQNYKWLNENTLLSSVGKKEYPAMYIPEDFINEKASVTWIEVEVKPHQSSPELGTKYTVKYVPHLTAQMVGIPEGWEIGSTKELKMGDNDVIISYSFPDGTTAHENVTITVEKGDMNIQGVMVTVIENTKLTNDILPQVTNGKLEFESGLDKIINENTTLTCTFTPNDTEHYNSTYEIPVIVNVVPQAIIKSLQSSNNTEQNSEKTSTQTNENTNDSDKNTTQTAATTEQTKKTETKKDSIAVNSGTQTNATTTETASTTTTTEKTTEKTTESSKKKKTSTNSTKKKTSTKKSTTSNSTSSSSTATSNSNSTKAKDLSLNSTKTTEATTESTKKNKNKSDKKTDIKNLEGSKTNDSTTTGNKIQMKDIDLTKKNTNGSTETKKQTNNENGKVVVETIDLTKQKNTENSIITDDSKSEATSEVITDSTTEKKTTADDTENKTEEKKEKKDKKTTKENNIFGNKILLIFVGIAGVIFAGLIIFVIKIIQRSRMR